MAIVGTADIKVRAITDDFKRDIQNSLKDLKSSTSNIGNDIGKDFSRSVNKGMNNGNKNPFSKLEKEAEQARKSFNKLIKTGYLLGPAIAGAVSAVGDLVMGLFAVGSAVGAAAPALGVLPGILAAIGQAAITAKLAFGGVTKGIGALLKPKTGGGGGGNNDAAIADARRRLAQVYQQAAEKMASANDKVRKAQIALNQAYEQGAESLQQLGFDAEDAAIAQQKAAIELERARETLMRIQDLPADSRARREAELAFKEADLNYRQAADRSNDLAKVQEYAAKTGIEGTKEVLSAKQDLAEAEADLAKTQRDNAQDILEAQLALQRAMQKTNQGASSSVNALKDLSAEAKSFATYIASLKPVFLDLRAAAGRQLFGPLTNAMSTLVSDFVPVLLPLLENMGRVIGQLALRFVQMLTSVRNLDIFEKIFGGTNITVMRNIGYAVVDLAEGALNLLDAVSPLTIQFSEFIRKTASSINNTIKFKNATGELTASFERAADFAKSIGGLLKSAFEAFKSLGGGATTAGTRIIDAFTGAFDKLKAFSDEAKATGELQQKFNAIADNIIAIGGFLGEVGKLFYQISGNAGVKAFFDAIKPIPGIFASIFNQMTSTGPIFGELLVNISLLIKSFSETGGIQLFFSVLNEAAKVLVALFSNEIVQKVFLFLAAIKGLTLAIGVLGTTSNFVFKVMLGNLTKMPGLVGINGTAFIMLRDKILGAAVAMDTFGRRGQKDAAANALPLGKKLKELTTGFRMLAVSTWSALGPFLLIAAAIAVVVAVFVMMYKNSEKLRNAFSNLGNALKGAFSNAIEKISKAFSDASGTTETLSDLFKLLGDATAVLVDWLSRYLVHVIGRVADGFARVASVAGTVTKWFKNVFGGSKEASDGMTALTDSQEATRRAMEETAAKAKTLYTEFGSLSDIQGKLANESASAYDKITAQSRAFIDAGARATELKNVHTSLAETLKTGGLNVDQQKQAMNDFAGKIHDAAKESLALGGSVEDATKIVADGRQTFLDQAKALGYSADEAKRMADKVGLTPETIKKKFAVTGLDDLREATKQLADLETLAGSANARESRGAAKFADQRILEIKAKLATKLTVVFNKGTAGDPLYVKMAARALGGPVSKNETYLVGEKGPELFSPGSNGNIVPNDKLMSISSNNSSGTTIIVNPSQGMDEVELAHVVSRQVAWNMKRGV